MITTAGTLPWGLWWHENGRQLLVIDAEHRLLRVDVQTTPEFSAGTPRVVGRLPFPPVNSSSIDAMPDLQRLLAIVPEQVSAGRSLTVLRHWQETVGARTP